MSERRVLRVAVLRAASLPPSLPPFSQHQPLPRLAPRDCAKMSERKRLLHAWPHYLRELRRGRRGEERRAGSNTQSYFPGNDNEGEREREFIITQFPTHEGQISAKLRFLLASIRSMLLAPSPPPPPRPRPPVPSHFMVQRSPLYGIFA